MILPHYETKAGGCNLYRYAYLSDLSYAVYRHQERPRPRNPRAFERMVRTHRLATFVAEQDAAHFCIIRNAMTAAHGSDAVPELRRANSGRKFVFTGPWKPTGIER